MAKLISYISFLLFFLVSNILYSQKNCDLFPVQAANYIQGSCNGLLFQGVIGSTTNKFGDCGDIIFTPVITGGDIISASQDDNSSNEIVIYPNPAFDKLSFYLPNNSNIGTLRIINILGQTIITHNHVSSKGEIDISQWKSGAYFLIFADNHIKLVKKFIKSDN